MDEFYKNHKDLLQFDSFNKKYVSRDVDGKIVEE